MSASILHPVLYTTDNYYHKRSPTTTSIRKNINMKKMDRIKRDLFGPADPFEISKIFEDEIQKQQETASKKWGFDFRNGLPLDKSQFIWERVPFTDLVPTMYTLSRAAHVREIISSSSSCQMNNLDVYSSDELMDERANRENTTEEIHMSLVGSSNNSHNNHDHNDTLLDEHIFKVPLPDCLLACNSSSAGKRQPKITEYMNKRKRLSATPKKIYPPKRLRSNSSLVPGSNSDGGVGHYALFGTHQTRNKSN